ncbi:MAG: metallophosphoesterase [Bacteroidota bacterium]
MNSRYLLSLIPILFLGCTVAQKAEEPSYFYAFGDMPYKEEHVPKYNQLVKQINETDPAFTIHVGDTKSGSTLCTDEFYQKTLAHFNSFNKPLIYTLGDNEWTDCDREACGGYDAEERLSFLRNTMFVNPTQSFGKHPIDVISQSTIPPYEKYVENVMWKHKDILFSTVHICGSSNNLLDEGDNEEFFQREAADIFWLKTIFQKAMQEDTKAFVLAFHANMFTSQDDPGYRKILAELKQLIYDFKKPVLGIYGDSHRFLISQPLYLDGKLLTNFTALMVFGSADVHYVKINMDINRSNIFDIEPVYVD